MGIKEEEKTSTAWIRTTMCQSVGLQKSLIDHWATTYCIYILEKFTYISLPVLITLKLHDLLVCTIQM